MRIECSSCGSLVKVQANDNGEINCPRCGAGLLMLPQREAEIARHDNPLLTDELGEPLPRRQLAPFAILGAVVVTTALIAAALVIWAR